VDVVVPLIEFLAIGLLFVNLAHRMVPEPDREWMRSLLLASLLLRLTAATAFAMAPGLRVFHEDATGYEHAGMTVASMWRGEYPPFRLEDRNNGFIYLAGSLNFLFGRFRPVLAYFNCVLGTALVFFVYRLAIRFFHPQVGRMTALLVGLMPSLILWSSIALKDTLVTLLLVISLSACVSLKERISVPAVVGAVGPLLAIGSIRFYMMYFVAFAIAVSLVLDRSGRFLTGIYKQIFLAAVAVGLLAMLGMTERTESDMTVFSLEYASNYRRGMAISANSGFDADVDLSTPGGALGYLPIGVAHLLWAPFPWQMTSLRAILAAPETIFWWFLFPATVRGISLAIRRRFAGTSGLIIFTGTLTCAYSLIHGNVGSAFRQRAQILVFLFIFSAAGIYVKRLRRAGFDERHVLNGGADEISATVSVPVPAIAQPILSKPGQPVPRA
jgi:hypothetical protein